MKNYIIYVHIAIQNTTENIKKTNMNDKHTSSYVHVDIKICNDVVKILSYH